MKILNHILEDFIPIMGLKGLEELDGAFDRVLQRIKFLEKNADTLNTELTGADKNLQQNMFIICRKNLCA